MKFQLIAPVSTLLIGFTLTCTGCEPAVADDSANLRPPRMRGSPNPAAVNCINKGGALETLTQADGGQYGVCLFSDGSACGDWALFRGECAKGDKPFFSAYCADSGGEMSNEDVIFMSYGNAPATYEVCTVNGAQCAAEDYYSTGCVSAVSKSSAESDKGNNCAGNPAQELFIKLTLARQFAVQFVGLYSLGDGDNDIEGDELEHLVDIVSQVTGVERDEVEEYIEKYDEEVTLNDVEAEVLKAWQDTCAAEMKEMLDGVILPRIAGVQINGKLPREDAVWVDLYRNTFAFGGIARQPEAEGPQPPAPAPGRM